MKKILLSVIVMCISASAIAQTQNQTKICDNGKTPVQVGVKDNYHVKVTTTTKNNESTTNNSGQHNFSGGLNAGGKITGSVKVVEAEGSINGNAGYNYKGKTGSTTNETGSTTTKETYYRCEDDKKQTK